MVFFKRLGNLTFQRQKRSSRGREVDGGSFYCDNPCIVAIDRSLLLLESQSNKKYREVEDEAMISKNAMGSDQNQ